MIPGPGGRRGVPPPRLSEVAGEPDVTWPLKLSAALVRPETTSPYSAALSGAAQFTADPPTIGLRTTDLSKTFGGVRALDGVTVSFRHRRINALIGPHGSGKTTLLDCVTGGTRPEGGRVTYHELEITRRSPARVARAGIGRTLQPGRTFGRRSALDTLLVAARAGGVPGRLRGARRRAARDRAFGWMNRLGIEHLAEAEARTLSPGEQRLLELAGVLMADPKTVLLDEPARGLDPEMLERIATVIGELNAEGRTVVVAERAMEPMVDISDHVVVLDRGRAIAQGPPSVIRADERVLEAFCGEQIREGREGSGTRVGRHE